MRSIVAWFGLGLACAGLTAGLLGQRVWGQPDYPPGPPPPKPLLPIPRNVSAVDPPGAFPLSPSSPDVLPLAPPSAPPASPDGVRQAGGFENPPSPPGKFDFPPQNLPPLPGALPIPSKVNEPPSSTVSPANGLKKDPCVSVEWIGPGGAKLNQPMTCQILVRNTGPVAVEQVIVRHRPPDGVQQRGSKPAAIVEAGVMTWNIGNLEPGQIKRIDLHLASSVRGQLHCHADVTFTTSSTLQVLVREPLLNVKVNGPEKVIIGEPVTFTVTLSNPGDGLTDNITVKTMLGEGLEQDSRRMIEMNAGQLAPKESKTLQVVCQARVSGMAQTTFLASADGGLKATDTVNLEVMQPKLDLAFTGPKLRYIDRHAVYALKVTNPGSAPAGNVTLTQVVPAGFKFQAASGSGHFDESTRTVVWALGDLMPGQNREMNVELIATSAGEHKLNAQVNTARGIKTDAETQTRVEGLSSLQVEVVDVDDPVEVGAETAYEIRISNSGTKTETNLRLVCSLPEQMEFRGARNEADLRFRVEGKELVFEPLPKLAPRASIVYRVQAKGLQPGALRFRAQVHADSLSEPISREETTRVYSDDAPLR